MSVNVREFRNEKGESPLLLKMSQCVQFWKKNVSAVKKRSFDFSLLFPTSPKKYIKILQCSNGSLTVSFNGKLLHSRFDPEREGEKFANGLHLQTRDHVLLYGFGLGYHIPPILEKIGPAGKIIVLEFNSEILETAFALRDLSSLLLHPNFFLIGRGSSEYDVSGNLKILFSKNWEHSEEDAKKIAIFSPSYQFFPSGYESLKKAFELKKMEKRFDVLLGDAVKQNQLKNRKHIETAKEISEFYGKYEGYLGVLVGSGPSLDESFRYLKYLPRKSFLLAVDSSFSALLKNGIKVDALLSVDPQEAVFQHVSDQLNTHIPLFFMAESNHTLVRNYPGEKFFISRKGRGERQKQDGARSGGAVSCVGLELLIKLTVSPIIQIGIDSSFPGERYYANHISEVFHDEINQLTTLRDAHMRKITVEKRVFVANYAGGTTASHLNLYSYLRTVEELASAHNDVSIGIAGSSGARIDGVYPTTFSKLLHRKI
ncbi:MAG: motility associated factor glycosyltransferase family protein [Nitrospinota bacterium]